MIQWGERRAPCIEFGSLWTRSSREIEEIVKACREVLERICIGGALREGFEWEGEVIFV